MSGVGELRLLGARISRRGLVPVISSRRQGRPLGWPDKPVRGHHYEHDIEKRRPVGRNCCCGDNFGRHDGAASKAWESAEHIFGEAARRVGFAERSFMGLVAVETSEGSRCCDAEEIREEAEHGRLSLEQRDVALAEIERQQREGQELRRALGIAQPWRDLKHWTARFWDLEARLLDMPAATPRGICAKLRGYYHDDEIAQIRAGQVPDNDLPAEWAASVYRDLERLSEAA